MLRFEDGRIDARGVQHRAAGAIDGPRVVAREREDPRGVVRAGLGNDVDERGPAAAQSDDLVLVVAEEAIDEGLDGRVEAGNIAAAGEDADASSHER